MKSTIMPVALRGRAVLAAACAILVSSGVFAGGSSSITTNEPLGFLIRTNYHGWTNSILVSNGRVEAVIVPQVGRVMQFRFAGDGDGPFWENPALAGKAPLPESKEWGNFGGDKTWPAPQSDWDKITPRAWPPPVGFDAMPNEAQVDGFIVTLVSPVDPHYGIRARRRIELDLDRPVMTITTTYEKVSGTPQRISVWVITQLKDPVAVYANLPLSEHFREGYTRQSDELPANLKVDEGVLSLTRDPKTGHKIGTDASTLVWVGKEAVVRIDAPHRVFGEYPDEGSSAEIYTSADPLQYVELEMLGSLSKMISGKRTTRSSTYTLLRRTEVDPDLEVRKLFSH